jgi:hypothetical protein
LGPGTQELAGQSDQPGSAFGFFRTGDTGQAAPARAARPKPNGALGKLKEAVTHSAVTGSKKPAKSGVALQMRETGDHVDKEFERY